MEAFQMAGEHYSAQSDTDRRLALLERRIEIMEMKHQAINDVATALANVQGSVRKEVRELAAVLTRHILSVERQIQEDRARLNDLVVQVTESNARVMDGLLVADRNGEKADANAEKTDENTAAIKDVQAELESMKGSLITHMDAMPDKVAMAIKAVHGVEFIGWSADQISSYLIKNKARILAVLAIVTAIAVAYSQFLLALEGAN